MNRAGLIVILAAALVVGTGPERSYAFVAERRRPDCRLDESLTG